MTAFHSTWTKPFLTRHEGAAYSMPDYEILTTLLSALEWRRHNGSIKMITDRTGAAYYHHLGIEHIWDGGVDTVLDDAIDKAISPLSFWAAGKIYALQRQAAPCVMIDTDFIIWKPLKDKLESETLAVIHREGLSESIYPPESSFDMSEDYQFPDTWDWTVEPCNTAFLYIADETFKSYYTARSIEFMKNLRRSKDITAEMVFAEQRLLAMCAQEKNIGIKGLLDAYKLEDQECFTHVWGLKSQMQSSPETHRNFLISCIKRISLDFPEELPILKRIESIAPYIRDIEVFF
jgi:hypothetical protein